MLLLISSFNKKCGVEMELKLIGFSYFFVVSYVSIFPIRYLLDILGSNSLYKHL